MSDKNNKERKSFADIVKTIHYNSPVILTFTLLSFGVLMLSGITNGASDRLLFSVYRSSWADPLGYFRLFGHVLGHANMQHFTGNFMVILLVGPMLEERYGSKPLLLMIGTTALVTGLVFRIFAPANTALLGASGIVFMLIILSSYVNLKRGRIPLTLIFVLVIYLGREFIGEAANRLGATDTNIAHSMHIVGGFCGAAFGFIMFRNNDEKR